MQSHLRSIAFALLAAAMPAAAQQSQSLSLAEAIRIAHRESEAVHIAQIGADRALGQFLQARSQRLPQITASASYQRLIQSQFKSIADQFGGGSDTSGAGAFTNSPLAAVFASENTMVLGLTGSQLLYAGGRVNASLAAADAGRRTAAIAERSARAALVFSVAQAYFDAQLAERLVSIADSTFDQAERALRQTQLSKDVGNTAEYDLLRARVQRDNARPVVLAARTRRDIAFQSLRQVLNLPPNATITLTTSIEDATAAPPADIRSASDVVASTIDTTADQRAAVREAAEAVRAQEAQLRIAKSSRLPQIALQSTYQRFSYPSGVIEDRIKAYYPNWTASLGLSIPVYTGGRLHGEEIVARANLAEAQERLKQTREAASLDSRMVLAELELAEATYTASAGTDEQAARAYSIAEVRFNEGIATQLELTQARVDLSSARANRAQTARDLAIARIKAALIRDLPFGTSAGAAAPTGR